MTDAPGREHLIRVWREVVAEAARLAEAHSKKDLPGVTPADGRAHSD